MLSLFNILNCLVTLQLNLQNIQKNVNTYFSKVMCIRLVQKYVYEREKDNNLSYDPSSLAYNLYKNKLNPNMLK